MFYFAAEYLDCASLQDTRYMCFSMLEYRDEHYNNNIFGVLSELFLLIYILFTIVKITAIRT